MRRALDEPGSERDDGLRQALLGSWHRLDPDTRELLQLLAGDRVDLWRRASDSALSAGEHLLAVRLREEAIAFVDEMADPVRAVRLRLPLYTWRRECGLEGHHPSREVEATRAVLEMAEARCPGTPEHAQALARHAHAEVWNGDESAVAHAAEAVGLARRTGSTEALAWALTMRSETPPWERGLEHARQALALARRTGDPELVGWATTRTANRLDPGAGGALTPGGRPHLRRDRRGPVHQREDGRLEVAALVRHSSSAP